MTKANKPKGGVGSGRKPGAAKPKKPDPTYTERVSARNPGKPRAGVSPHDIFPERYNPDGTLKR